MQAEVIKFTILEVDFLFNKIFILTTSLALSIFAINKFHIPTNDLDKKVVNINNKIDLNFLSIHDKKLKEKQNTEKFNDINIDEYINTKNENINEINNSNTSYKDIYTVEATAYTGDTITATGTTPTYNPDGISTIAVDPTIIPLGSRVYIPGYGEAIASDTGLAIKGNKIDLFLNSEKECIDFGKQNVTLYVLSYPE